MTALVKGAAMAEYTLLVGPLGIPFDFAFSLGNRRNQPETLTLKVIISEAEGTG